MTALDLASIILTLLSSALIVAGAARWYIQHQVKPIDDKVTQLFEVIEDVRAETKTNGGSSMRDEIKFIKKQQEEAKELRKETNKKLDHLYDMFVEYIAKNSKN